MRLILIVVMFCIFAGCNAKAIANNSVENDCQYTRAALAMKMKAPADANIVNSYWQKTKDESSDETVDRLYLVFADGSSATIEHKYCSMYNFSFVYYAKHKDDINDEKKVAAIINRLFGYSAVKVVFKKPLLNVLESAFKSKNYNGQGKVDIALPADNIDINDSVEYGAYYYPLSDIGVAEGAVGLTMSIGGM
ncbi:MAG TPA: hypothetical protein VN030_03460 [Cellvibrio sp.]|nr:hypothetical protein [Cellvibrio sp.]